MFVQRILVNALSRLVRSPQTHRGLRILAWFYITLLVLHLLARLIIGDGFWLLAWLNNFTPYAFVPLIVILSLAFLLHSKRLIAGISILLALGGVVYLPRFIPDNPGAQPALADAEHMIKIVTFNVWGANRQLDDVITWLRETDADVILLQEMPPVWTDNGILQLRDLYPYQVGRSLEVGGWGNATLSRFPITHYEQFLLGNSPLPTDRLEITVGDRVIAAYNVHIDIPQTTDPHMRLPIDNPFLNMALKYDDRQRNTQIDQLLIRLETESYPVIVAGDFNMSDNAMQYFEIAGQLNDSFREGGFGIGATWPHAEVAGFPHFVPPLLRIDYIWHSAEFTTVDALVGAPLGSDHLPLTVTLYTVNE